MINRAIGNESERESLPNGPGAAAVLAMGIGSLFMSVLAIIADQSLLFKKMMMFYTPTGPLSGVTTTAVVLWLVSWIALDTAWKRRNVNGRIVGLGLFLLAIRFALMFPPIGDFF
jgi:hypothetical protein